MDVEQNLISKIIQDGNLQPVLDAGITVQHFYAPEESPSAKAYQWIVDFWSDYKESPGLDAFEHAFPDYVLEEAPEPYEFYIDEVKKQHRYAVMVDAFNAALEPLKDHDVDDAIFKFQEAIESISNDLEEVKDKDFVIQAKYWMEYYEKLRVADNHLLGIPSGFEGIDFVTSGFCKGQLITLVGLPKSMKSTMLLLFNIAAHKHNCKTMFVTFEMTNEEQELRHYCFRAGISYNRLRHGQLTAEEEKRLKWVLRTMEAYEPMVFVEDRASATTVTSIAAKAAKYEPDIIFVDGVYMMDSENPQHIPGSPQALTHITRNLKKMAMRLEVPVVCTTQALASKYSKARGLELTSIGYASSFGQDSDIVFGVERTDDSDLVQLKVIAARNNPEKDIQILVDWEQGVAEETYQTEEEEDSKANYGDDQ